MTSILVRTSKNFNIEDVVVTQPKTGKHTGTEWVVKDLATGYSLRWSGSDFTYDTNLQVTGGKATRAALYDASGTLMASANFSKNWDFSAQGAPLSFAGLMTDSNVLVGGAGDDVLGTLHYANSTPLAWSATVESVGNYYEDPEDLTAVISNGVIHVPPSLSGTGYYWTQQRLALPASFDGDNFKLEARVRNAEYEGGISAYDTSLNVNSLAEVSRYFGAALMHEGWAQSYASVYASGMHRSGLSGLVQPFDDWHVVSIETKNHHVIVQYDGVTVADEEYVEQVGLVDQLTVGFKGSGSTDWVKAYANGQLILQDDFDTYGTQLLPGAVSSDDVMRGGMGDDIYRVDSVGDKVIELASGGMDTIYSLISFRLADDVENLTLTGMQPINGVGNIVANVLKGNDANNALSGAGGDDTLIGSGGNDVLSGGNGIDVATFNGISSDYECSYANGVFIVRDMNPNDGDEGEDRMTQVEQVKFSDRSYLLGDKTIPVSLSANNLPASWVTGADYLRALQSNDSAESKALVWKDTTIKYYFDKHDDTLSWTYLGGLFDSAAMSAFKKALDYYSAITPLEFIRTENPAEATFKFNLVTEDWIALHNNGNRAVVGAMNFPGESDADSTWLNDPGVMYLKQSSEWIQGEYSFSAILHELGHGLGLQHPHFNGSRDLAFEGVDPNNVFTLGLYGLNQGVYTVMTYNLTADQNSQVEDGAPATPMALDVAALQALYGSDAYREGNNAYRLSDDSADWVCIWDTGGTDSITYDGVHAAKIDLRAATIAPDVIVTDESIGGYLSRINDIKGGYTIAHGVTIENAKGGQGDDTVQGNDAGNLLEGRKGLDQLTGFDGNDTLYGGAGKDTLSGDAGNDVLDGGAGMDMLTGGAGNDIFSFWTASDANGDKIMDFQLGVDKLDLSKIDAVAGVFGSHEAFSYSTVNPVGNKAGYLYFDEVTHKLKGWTEANAKPSFEITLTGITKSQLDQLQVSDWLV